MDFILEKGEPDVRSSLTDEGFQDMSTSAVSSIRTVHTDVLDRYGLILCSMECRNIK
jgi:hypothetical protein